MTCRASRAKPGTFAVAAAIVCVTRNNFMGGPPRETPLAAVEDPASQGTPRRLRRARLQPTPRARTVTRRGTLLLRAVLRASRPIALTSHAHVACTLCAQPLRAPWVRIDRQRQRGAVCILHACLDTVAGLHRAASTSKDANCTARLPTRDCAEVPGDGWAYLAFERTRRSSSAAFERRDRVETPGLTTQDSTWCLARYEKRGEGPLPSSNPD